MEKCNIKALAVAIGALWAFSVLLLAWMAAFGWGREMVTVLASLTWAMPPLFWVGSLEQSGLSLTAPLPGRSLPGFIIWSRRNKIFENYYDYYPLLMALQEEFESLGNRFFRWRSYLPLFMAVLFLAALLSQPGAASPDHPDRPWQTGCLLVSLAGLVLRFFTVGFAPRGTSGRNTLSQVAETLNTTGMYSLVRNPLYLGNFLIWLGLSLFIKVWWCTVIVILCFILF